MKKIFILSLFAMILFGCDNKVGEDMPKAESNGITYFVDTTTGICFGKIKSYTYNSYQVASITCVPCDSLKKIGLKK